MGMLKDHKFWTGLIVGVIALWVYQNHFRKGMG